jgi:hypothetical protein
MMLTLHTDVLVTRRKRLHLVEDENGDVVFTSHKVWGCLCWLVENEHYHFHVAHEGDPLKVIIGTVRD